MVRIIIVSDSRSNREQLSSLLTSSGFHVYRCCSSGSELRRILNTCEDGVVIMAGTVPDGKPDELLWDFTNRIQLLLIARPTVLQACDSPDIFRLALPVSASRLLGAVEMLTQLHRMRLPRREGNAKAIVDQAKQLLMDSQGISEAEAHRTIQRYAMDHGMKMADYSAQLLASRETEE